MGLSPHLRHWRLTCSSHRRSPVLFLKKYSLQRTVVRSPKHPEPSQTDLEGGTITETPPNGAQADEKDHTISESDIKTR